MSDHEPYVKDSLERAISKYNEVMQENYKHRVDLMSQVDMDHYFKTHNLPSCDTH